MLKDRRKKILINPKFQIKFVGFFITFFLLNFLITVGVISFSFKKFAEMGISLNLAPDSVFFEFLRNQQNELLLLILISTIISTAVAFIGGLYLSHKVAGPILNICTQLDSSKGKKGAPTITVREDDFFQELPESINKFISQKKKSNVKKAG
ncbi:MAG: hypothetical protein DRQ88_13215 [Epsilonproteobacteria bacterium]|nr:MAG: hypothetical protein DRQ88_13215 [Campylobacterota bacterium]